jgi:N-acetylglucosamine-6-phosphate deacetylase
VVGLALGDALQMATLTPARILGVDDRVGKLAPGYPADLVILDRATLNLTGVFMGGEPVGDLEAELWASSTV